ncbi:ABC transporter substrate-binding protein [Actinomadura barringtoniae]|uniref:ABC transporter substrate-binding protein n=1 Tax=Actinomadura barringtoniae TaxID=1427535 RepID=A0A939T8D9_9ACTN|nr:ABC transporter substrate-binding protein [Actinomadura barringtoniae]MBO2450232.1 ABC transporter substrate-binding protein [Actinomadura barringtoniae]
MSPTQVPIRRGPLKRAAAAAVMVVLAASAAGCSGKASGGSSSGGIKTGPGVTKDKITLAALTDLTGPYAVLGKSVTQAQKLYYDQLNNAGGVCGRKIDLVVRDHGYDVQKALAAYSELAPRSAAIPQVIGSPITMALRPRLENDHLLTLPQAWAHTLLGSKYVQVTGTTYDVDMVNAVAFLTKAKGIKSGDKIGHLRLEGDYGQSALAGVRYAAGKAGLTVVEQQVKATDADMTAQAGAFKKAGVKAILVSVSPKQAASLVGVSAAMGLNVPFAASNSAFAQQLLATPVGPIMQKNYYVVTAAAPFSADIKGLKKLAGEYQMAYKGQPLDSAVLSGYTTAAVVGEALKKACANKDLTRDGIVAAHRSTRSFDLGLGGAPEDFSQWTAPAGRASYITRPDKTALGGTVMVEQATESDLAKGYSAPSGG